MPLTAAAGRMTPAKDSKIPNKAPRKFQSTEANGRLAVRRIRASKRRSTYWFSVPARSYQQRT